MGSRREVKDQPVQRGTIIVHKSGSVAVIRERKSDDTGWWLVGFGGIADCALENGNWVVPLDDEIRWAVLTTQDLHT